MTTWLDDNHYTYTPTEDYRGDFSLLYIMVNNDTKCGMMIQTDKIQIGNNDSEAPGITTLHATDKDLFKKLKKYLDE
jgi:hypothetical protein